MVRRRRPVDERRRAWAHRLGSVALPALLAVVVPVAALGALGPTPARAAWTVPLGAAVVAAVVAVGHDGFPREPQARRTVALAAAWGALSVPFAGGVAVAGPAGAGAVALVVLLGGFALADGLSRTILRSPVEALREVAGELSLTDLCEQWRRTEEAVGPGGGPAERAAALEVRAVLLEELAHRDPGGFARWVREGAEDPPDRWLGQDATS